MKALKRLACALLALSLLFGDGWLVNLAGLDFAKPLTTFAATATDCYDAYDTFIDLINGTESAAEQLDLKVNSNADTRVKTAGADKSLDMSTLWKISKDKYSHGVYSNYFTYEQKNIDAAAQVKSGKWLNDTTYEAMAGTPTTERLFVTMGGSQWIVDMQYRMVQAKYLRRYIFHAGAPNYTYYVWDANSSGSSGQHWDETTIPLEWNFNPYRITYGNVSFRKEEGYDITMNAASQDKYQGDKSTVLINSLRVPTKDGFHTGSQIFRHDAGLNSSLTPNQYTVIALKKYVYDAIHTLTESFKKQSDNYRADQGLSDPAYDDTGAVAYYRSIGWNYTYQFMARKGNNHSNNFTGVVGSIRGGSDPGYNPTSSAWYPCFITYLYDWQMYHEAGGLTSDYPSATLAFNKYSKLYPSTMLVAVIKNSIVNFDAANPTMTVLFPTKIELSNILKKFSISFGIYGSYDTSMFHTYQWAKNHAGLSVGQVNDYMFCDIDYFADNAVAFGYTSPSAGMKLTPSQVGNAINMTYKTSSSMGLEYDLVNAGYVPQAELYMFGMYYLYWNFGPLFYTSELSELFADCPWYKANSGWTTQKTNQFLGMLFGAVTAEEYNSNVANMRQLKVYIPMASFPRGGDLDGTHTFGEDTAGGTIEVGAIKELEPKDLFGVSLTDSTNYTYSWNFSVSLAPITVYTYGPDQYCLREYAAGGHCDIAWKECTSQHGGILPAPSGADGHGNTYTSGYAMHTQYGTETVSCCTCKPCACEECNCTDSHATSWSYSGCHHQHYHGMDAFHEPGYPNQSHAKRHYFELVNISIYAGGNVAFNGHFTSVPAMGYDSEIDQLFTNVQWLDITSHQIWMMNRGQSKGLSKILASPVTVDADNEILQTAVVDQKGYTLYNIVDPDGKRPNDGLTTLGGNQDTLQAQGRVANSFNIGSSGNNEYDTRYRLEWANPGARSQMRAVTLSFLANDAPSTRGTELYQKSLATSRFYDDYQYVNGDVHAFQLKNNSGDTLYFHYNPMSQGGRSNTSFNGFVLQALAHTLYYPARTYKGDIQEHPTRGNSYWISYSNSLRIQGDYLGIDYLAKQATDQQTISGYMYDTWEEKDDGTSCNVDVHGHKFKLVKDSEDGYTDLAKYNVRCTWVPGRFSYLMSRGPEDQIFGPGMSDIITETNNCFMIHTFCRGINGNKHACWDSIAGDSGGSNCSPGSDTEMGTVVKESSPDGRLEKAIPNRVGSHTIQIKLNYWDGVTPYKHVKTAFRSGETYNNVHLYASVNDPAPYVGYGADDAGGKDGTHDITLNGKSKNYQRGYHAFVTNCKFDVSHTMVSDKPYVNSKGKTVSFAKFGVEVNHPPKRLNTDKDSRGKVADGANDFSSKYPWLQMLDLNRYLANDRYTTGSAQIEYVLVGEDIDTTQKAWSTHAHTATSDVPNKGKYFYQIKKFGGGYLTPKKVIYVNAAYRRDKSVGEDNFYGNPNDIVVYNPVASQSAHVVPISTYLPDATNVGTKKVDGKYQREYTETYLKSFLTYVKRDSRIAYKYDLDNVNGDAGTEKVVNTSSMFVAHNTTAQEYTEEEYYGVSNANTTYTSSGDYTYTKGESTRYVLNNTNPTVTVSNSGAHNIQFVSSSTSTSEMVDADLEGGDDLIYDQEHGMLFVQMHTDYTMKHSTLVRAYNAGVIARDSDDFKSAAIAAARSYLLGKVSDLEASYYGQVVDEMFSQWWAYSGFYSDNSSYAIEGATSTLDAAISSNPDYNRGAIEAAFNAAISAAQTAVNTVLLPDSYNGVMEFHSGDSATVQFDTAESMRKGALIKVSIQADRDISSGMLMLANVMGAEDKDKSGIASNSVYKNNGKTLEIYIEAQNDNAVAEAISLDFSGDCGLQDITVESLNVPLLSAAPKSGTTLSKTGLSYYTEESNWAFSGVTIVSVKNALLVKSSSKTTFDLHGEVGFVIESSAYAEAGATIKSDATGPHIVANANWRYYVLDGWHVNGSVIQSSDESALYNTASTLQAPSGWKPSVESMITGADNKTLLLYRTNNVYKLAWSSDARRWDADDEKLYIKSTFYGTEDPVDFMSLSDKDIEDLTVTMDPHDLSFYRSVDVTKYYIACLFYASNSNTMAYDVQYSSNEDHKYSPDSPDYSKDVFTTTTTRYFFTEEAYQKIFGSYLSLDDEYTIYWDNYSDLVNNAAGDDTEGIKSNLKATSKVLGRGWDNRKDSQSNLDDDSKSLANSSAYSKWATVKKYDYWKDMSAESLSKVTDCTKWIYTKYVIFNVDMYAFSTDKSYVYDDTKGPNEQEGKWDPTTPAFKKNGEPNHIVYIPAGSHVQLGYYGERKTDKNHYGTNDDNGRFIDYGYHAYYGSTGNVKTPLGEDKYTRDPNGYLYTYHFWVPLSVGESDSAVTVQYVVNGINSVEDYEADVDEDNVIDDPTKAPDTADSLGNNKGKPTLSGSGYNVKQFLTKSWKGKDNHKQTDSHSSAFKRGVKDEWGNSVINASGLQVLNNVLGIRDLGKKKDENGAKYFTNKTAKVYRRANNSVNSSTVSVVGSIGNFAIVDVGDPRYQDTFKLSTTDNIPGNYFLYPIVKSIQKYSNVKGEEGSQDYYMTDYLDARGRYKIKDANLSDMYDYSLAKQGGDTYSWNNSETSGSAAWYMASTQNTFTTETRVPNKHAEIVNDDQSIKVGYEQICTFETIGNYFGSRTEREGSKKAVNIDGDYGQTKLQIIPMYYAYNSKTGEKVNVDVYMKSGGTYTCINAGSEFANKEAAEVAKKEAEETDTVVTEKHYYDGPYYLDYAYNNAYTYGLTTNTAGDNGSTYLLDQHMLRYSITAKEAEVTYDVVKKLATEKNNIAAKKGITKSILDYYDYSDETSIGGKALDATYAYGNAQILYLREYNRTFIGGTTAALKEQLPTTAFSKAIIRNAGMYAQKWYFGIKLPSSTIFVRHGERLTFHKVTRQGYTYHLTTTDLSAEEGWTIYCRILVFAIGDKYVLISHTKPSLDPDPSDTEIKKDNRLTTVTINLNKAKSTIDLEGRGSH